MSWGRIDDNLHSSAKFAEVHDSAHPVSVWLHVLSWALGTAARKRPGFVPTAIAKRYGVASAFAKLVSAGLWKVAEDGFEIHDFDDYAERVGPPPELSSKRAEAGRKGGLARVANQATGQANDQASQANDQAKFAQATEAIASAGARARVPDPDPDPDPEIQENRSRPSGSGDQDQVPATRAGADSTRKRPDGPEVQASPGFESEIGEPLQFRSRPGDFDADEEPEPEATIERPIAATPSARLTRPGPSNGNRGDQGPATQGRALQEAGRGSAR